MEPLCNNTIIREKSVGTTELHYSTKKRKHSFGILKAFFVRHSSEYETSDNDRKDAPKHIQTIIFGSLGKQDRPFI